ncbi:TPA: hypothetical protein ACWMEY_000003 [Enterobacter cloacae]
MKNHILTFLRFTAIFSSLNCYVVYAHDMPPVLVNQDFTVQMEDEAVTLGERWTDDVARKIEVPIEGYFVGEVPFDGTHYKFYQHQKAGLTFMFPISGGIRSIAMLTIISYRKLPLPPGRAKHRAVFM